MIARESESFGPAFLLAGLALALMFAGALIEPPPVRAVNAASQFDAAGARDRLVRILGDQAPHPVDSAAQDGVRVRLLTEIRALGFAPELHESFECRMLPWGSQVTCGHVRNIVFSAGPQSGPAVLAATHYDSVPAGPGASDAGIGIASWLEVARVLSHEKLTRRVIFLMSDGEETALLGAQAFVRDPLMHSVEALVNLEARGTRGPAIFFETNRPNADSVRAFAAGARRPLANSIMADVYRLLPNATDVTVLRREGLDVINVALLDGYENYHTPRDSLATFNTRSLQHMGGIALGVTRGLASGRDADARSSLAFTDIASRIFIVMPEWAARFGLALGGLAAAWLLWKQSGDRRKALAAPVFALALGLLISLCIGAAISALRPPDYWFAYPQISRAWVTLSAFCGITLSLLALTRNLSALSLQAAGMLWFALIGFAGSWFLPGLSILFLLPSLIFGAGILAAVRCRPALKWSAILAALASLIIWAPSIHLAELAFGFEMPVALTGLTAIMLLPWIGAIAQSNGAASWKQTAMGVYAATLLVAVCAALAPSSSKARPQPLNITYFVDADKKQARFLAGGASRALPHALKRAANFAPQFGLPGDMAQSWSAPAPYKDIAAPSLRIVSNQISVNSRVVRARLHLNGAYRAAIRIPRSAGPSHALINGIDAPIGKIISRNDFVALACQGRACDGAEIVIYLAPGAKQREWTIIGQYLGAPDAARDLIAKRPASATPIQAGDGTTIMRRLAP